MSLPLPRFLPWIALAALGLTFFWRSAPLTSSADDVQAAASSAPVSQSTDPSASAVVEAVEDYFAYWHTPYGRSLPSNVKADIWEAIGRLQPTGPQRGAEPEPPWQLIGPKAMLRENAVQPNEYQGRVLDIEIVQSTTDVRIAAASGGLWWASANQGPEPIPIADELNTLVIGSFATHPTNPGHYLVGTGEPGPLVEDPPGVYDYEPYESGMGLFLTTDFGQTWTSKTEFIPPSPDAFYRVRWDPANVTTVHAVSSLGYYRSTDDGANWDWLESGVFTDILFHPFDPQVMWIGRWAETDAVMQNQGGLYKTTDGGDSWDRIINAPKVDVGRWTLTAGGTDPASLHIYASISRHSDPDKFLGIEKSTDAGFSWVTVNSPVDPNGDKLQAWYNNSIVCHPTQPNIVLVGWRRLYRSIDSGANWTEIDIPGGLHVDHHLLRWADDGAVYLATDGGVYISWDDGLTWETDHHYPITQFFHADVNPGDNQGVAGGSADNGFATSADPIGDGGIWQHRQGGDGGGVAFQLSGVIVPIWWTNGPNDGDHKYKNYLTINGGDIFGSPMTGIDPSSQWLRVVRCPRGASGFAVTQAGGTVYRWNGLDGWDKLNNLPFGATIKDLTIVDDTSDTIWVTTNSEVAGDSRILYRIGAPFWIERSADLPDGMAIRKVAGDVYGGDPLKGIAITNSMDDPADGNRLFRTTDGGATWQNITGNLPLLPVSDIVENPLDPDYLYLATEMGAYRSSDGGAHWLPWNDGWPKATIVMEFIPVFDFEFQDFWIYAATYGRSAFRRNLSRTISLDAPVAAAPEMNGVLAYPNPFRRATAFRVLLEAGERPEMKVFDVRGRLVRQLTAPVATAGWNRIEWDGRDDAGRPAPAGTYFAEIRTSKTRFTGKVTRVTG